MIIWFLFDICILYDLFIIFFVCVQHAYKKVDYILY